MTTRKNVLQRTAMVIMGEEVTGGELVLWVSMAIFIVFPGPILVSKLLMWFVR